MGRHLHLWKVEAQATNYLFYIILFIVKYTLHTNQIRVLYTTVTLYITSYTYTIHSKRKPSFTLPLHHRQSARSSLVGLRWFFLRNTSGLRRQPWSPVPPCVALIGRGDSSLFVATPGVNSSARHPNAKSSHPERRFPKRAHSAHTSWLRPKMASSVRWPAYTYQW